MPAIVQAGRLKRLEAQHGTREPFYCAMILFDDIIEILGMVDHDGRFLSLVVACSGCRIRASLTNGDLLREPPGCQWPCIRRPRQLPDREWG